jgi:hypothetical protein
MWYEPGSPSRPVRAATRKPRSMPASTMRSSICSRLNADIGAVAFTLPAKKPSFQSGRCDNASGVQMLTTASIAFTSTSSSPILRVLVRQSPAASAAPDASMESMRSAG